jgi:DNA polymerase III epsilon subunit family exonuclease
VRLTRLDRKLMAGIVGLFLLPSALVAGALIVLYRWGAFDDTFALLITVVVGLSTLMGYLALIAHTVGQSLVRAVREMQLGTELIATVNPAYRLAVTTGDELQLLAEEINHLADRLEAAPKSRGTAGEATLARDRAMDRSESIGHEPVPWPAGAASGPRLWRPASPDERLALDDFSRCDDADRGVTLIDRSLALDRLVYTVLDAETTGLAPSRGDRIVSIACVRIRNGAVRPSEVLDTLVNPGRSIPPESTRIHGITDGMVAGAPAIEAIVPDVLHFADGTVLAGHQVWFDLMFLREVTERIGAPPLTRSHPVLDTWLLSQFLHGPLGDHDLETVAVRLGVPPHGRHTARGDALMTAEILVRLLKILSKRGFGTLGEALDVMRRSRARFTVVPSSR